MNPSSSGWIKKFGHLVKDQAEYYKDQDDLYANLKVSGFIYGFNMTIPAFIRSEHRLSEDEKAKINLLTALYFTYTFHHGFGRFSVFVDVIFHFYKEMGMGASSFLHKILSGRSTISQLEKLLGSRVYLEDNVISKTFNSTITNSLLYIDVLSFDRYLSGAEKDVKTFAHDVEQVVINLTYRALNSRERKKKDEKLLNLFESSLTYVSDDSGLVRETYSHEMLERFNAKEKQYFLDMACLAVWEDHSLDYMESAFLFELGTAMNQEDKTIKAAIEDVSRFFDAHLSDIPQFREQHLAIQFYDSMARIVNKLILRNSKRLQKELSESRELVYLLSKSTLRELSEDEKKKVQDQLLDIFKSIPSLAIFILPGGAVLLPIFIKLIPKLLPSAFDENRVEKDS